MVVTFEASLESNQISIAKVHLKIGGDKATKMSTIFFTIIDVTTYSTLQHHSLSFNTNK